MSVKNSKSSKLSIRPVQYRDLEIIEAHCKTEAEFGHAIDSPLLTERLKNFRSWYGLFKLISIFPNPFRYHLCAYVAELAKGNKSLLGFIQIAPFNETRSTWRVQQVLMPSVEDSATLNLDPKTVGSQLLRHCFEAILEARTWVLEVDATEKDALALYRQNGFQPLAHLTYWSLPATLISQLAQKNSEIANLLPLSSADAQLRYQLDCVSMPPLLRQVFDRHIQDFKSSFLSSCINKIQQWCTQTQIVSGYVFEPQRKAAIGYFKLSICKDGSNAHQAELTVHPAYTWLYPQLLAHMAHLVQPFPAQSLQLASADYQHEREEYLDKLGAEQSRHGLLMSRSIWHKLKEARSEGLQLPEVLQGLQTLPRTPIPTRMPWLDDSTNLPSQSREIKPPNNNGHNGNQHGSTNLPEGS